MQQGPLKEINAGMLIRYAIKEETKATIRVIPHDENPKELKCIYSGKPARHEVLFAKAY